MLFSKSDFWLAVVAGEAIAILSIPIFKNIKIFEFVAQQNASLALQIRSNLANCPL